MNPLGSGAVQVISTAIAVVAVVALVAVLVLLAKQRVEVRRANALLALSRELRHRYDALQSVTKEGVLVQSLAGVVLDMSERAAAILGVDAASSVGRAIADLPIVLLNEQGLAMNPASVLSHRAAAPGGEGALLVGVALPGTDGTQARMVQVSSQLVAAADGEGAALLTTLVDVTGRREIGRRSPAARRSSGSLWRTHRSAWRSSTWSGTSSRPTPRSRSCSAPASARCAATAWRT